jgi:RHS repeat-associated protein
MNARMTAAAALAVVLCISPTLFGYDQKWDQDHIDHTPIDDQIPYGDDTYEDPGTQPPDDPDSTGYDDPVDEGPEKEQEDDCCDQNRGSPFLLNTGRIIESAEDLLLPGIGPQLHIKRTFNGADIHEGILGKGWYFFYGKSIARLKNARGDEYLYIRWKNGQKYRLKSSWGAYESVPGFVAPTFTVEDRGSGWKITEKSGTVYIFNEQGSVSEIRDKNGNTITVTHNEGSGCPKRAVNESGNSFDFTYGPDGRVSSIKDNFDRTVRYTYDENGNLTGVEYWDGGEVQYTYDDRSRLTSVTDRAGNLLWEVTYNERGKIDTFTKRGMTYSVTYYDGYIEEVDSLGNKTTIYFNDQGVITEKIFPDNTSIVRKPNPVFPDAVDWIEDEKGNRTEFTYDSRGNITSVTNAAGNTLKRIYDFNNRLIREVDPRGAVNKWAYDAEGNVTQITRSAGTPDEAVYTFGYDSEGNIVATTDALGNTTEYDYDDLGNVTIQIYPTGDTLQWEYDSLGRMVAHTDAEGNSVEYRYDDAGNKIREINALGDTLRWQYDENNSVTAMSDAEGNESFYGYDSYGRMSFSVNPLGDTTFYAYDHNDNLVMLDPPGSRPIYYMYDKRNRRIAKIIKMSEDTLMRYYTSDRDDIIERYEYDDAGNMTRLRDPNNNAFSYTYNGLNIQTEIKNPLSETTEILYDANGNDTLRRRPGTGPLYKRYDSANRLVSIADSLGLLISVKYNAEGLRTAITVPGKGTRRIAYDSRGQKIREQDSSGNVITYRYDGNGRITAKIDSSGAASYYGYDAAGRMVWKSNALGDTVRFEYDRNGNRTAVIDPDGNETKYAYDAMNRMVKITYPDGGEKQITYDAAGRITGVKKPGGVQIEYRYDDAGRLVYRSFDDGETPADTFTYDKAGQILTAANSAAEDEWQYDALGRVTRAVQKIGEKSFTVRHSYTRNSTLESITYPNGKTLKRQRDVRSRLTSLVWGYRDTAATFSYDGNNIETKTLGNGIEAEYEFTHGRLTGLRYTGGAGPLPSFAYGYTTAGLKRFAKDTEDVFGDETYSYDKAQRLIDFARGELESGTTIADPDQRQRWKLDSRANWTELENNGSTEKRTHNAVNEITVDNISHDADGNITKIGNKNFTWDGADRLSTSDNAEYAYDALGRRVTKTLDGGLTIYYAYDNKQAIYEENSNEAEQWYTFGDYVDDLICMDTDSSYTTRRYYYLTNNQYSVVMLTDKDGRAVERYSYDPFGSFTVVLYDTSGAVTGEQDNSSVNNPYFYTGRRYDLETGLYYFRARYYSGELGRFVNRDPAGYINGYNLYANYFTVNQVDPTGKIACQTTAVNLPSFSKEISVGPVKVQVALNASGSRKRCRKCCPQGTPRAGQWVTDEELALSIELSGSAEGKSWGSEIKVSEKAKLGFWAGIKITGGISGGVEGKMASNKCSGAEMTGSICLQGGAFLSISVGGEASIEVEYSWFSVSAAAGLTGTGTAKLTVKKCYVCRAGSCAWEGAQICIAGDITATVSVVILSHTWELWSGEKCWPKK